jgi:hypothetical protein
MSNFMKIFEDKEKAINLCETHKPLNKMITKIKNC